MKAHLADDRTEDHTVHAIQDRIAFDNVYNRKSYGQYCDMPAGTKTTSDPNLAGVTKERARDCLKWFD